MRFRKVSIGKDSFLNEDAVLADCNRIAVSDGAGGGGLFADKWASFLLEKLPMHPIHSFKALDDWINTIWESFYIELESMAKSLGSVELNKFYDEGSLATLSALWVKESDIEWINYGDSAVFCYDFRSKELYTSIKNPRAFNDAPYLININAPLIAGGFEKGTFSIGKHKLYFCATDALAHYILVSYMAANKSVYGKEIDELEGARSKNSNFIKSICSEQEIEFEKDVIIKILDCAESESDFAMLMNKLMVSGKLAYDDCSIAFLY